ncbi:MAG: hypothetical protein K0U52_05505 [Gammaproteobacteria bacterium]|nr:hypothetical protein [Gammaproteobacteria bacterium]
MFKTLLKFCCCSCRDVDVDTRRLSFDAAFEKNNVDIHAGRGRQRAPSMLYFRADDRWCEYSLFMPGTLENEGEKDRRWDYLCDYEKHARAAADAAKKEDDDIEKSLLSDSQRES